MGLEVLIAYAIGIVLGLLAARNASVGRVWPTIIRSELLVVAIALSIAAAWRISSIADVVWPLLMALTCAVMLVVAWFTTKEPQRAGHAALHTWAATPNTGFWVVPVATWLAGPAGAVVAVLFDRLGTPVFAVYTAMLRKSAPIQQRRRTAVIDQMPLIALAIGLLLHFAGPAPEWTATVTMIAAPLLAATGAAMFVGSFLHPTQRVDARPGLRRWIELLALRLLLFAPIVIFAPSTAIRIAALLAAFSIPAFGAVQMSTVYGYRDSVVNAAGRYSWALGAVGLAIAIVIAN